MANAPSPFEVMLRPPRPYTTPPASEDRMLTYTVRIRPVAERRFDLAALVGDDWLLDFGSAGDTVLNVMHWQGYTRIETVGPGLYGAATVVLRDPEGGIVHMDPTSRMFMRFAREQILPVRVSTSVQTSIAQPDPRDLSTFDLAPTRQATLDLGQARLRLESWWIDRQDLTPFGDDVTRVVIGEYDTSAAADPLAGVRSLGIPLRTRLLDSGGGALVQNDVIGLHLSRPVASAFEIPPSYVDFRSPDRRAAPDDRANFVRGTPVSLSTLRGGTRALSGGLKAGAPTRPNVPPGFGLPPSDDAGPPATDQPGTDGINIPQCFPATFGSQLALVVEQLLLDDLRAIVNGVTSRLGEFDANGGTITVNWLDQWRASPSVWDAATNTPTMNDDGLWCLLNTPLDPTNPHQQPGLLIQLAMRQIRRAIADGTLDSQITLDPGLSAQLKAAEATGTADPLGSMAPGAQTQLVTQYVNQRLGTFDLTYSTTTPLSTTFFGLVEVGLFNISFQVDFRRDAILTTLQAMSAGSPVYTGSIQLHIDLPHCTMSADIGRFPSPLYAATLAAVAASAGIFGLAGLVSGLGSAMVAAGLLIFSDIGLLYASLTNCNLDATITFIKEPPDPPGGHTPGILRPSCTAVSLNADAVIAYASFLPDNLHQLEAVITTIVGNVTSIVTDTVAGQIQTALDKLFQDTLALRFPPAVGPAPSLPLNGSWSGATPHDHLYLQAALDAGAGSVAPPYVTQVDPNVHDRLFATRTQFFADGDANSHRYAGFVISQNYLNQFINTRWKEGAFNWDLGMPAIGQIAQSVGDVIGVPLAKNDSFRAHIWPASSPRTVLTPRGQFDLGPYATTFFDDMRLCLEVERGDGGPSVVEIQFAVEAFTQVGFGGLDPATQRVSLGQFSDAFFELYFDLDHLGIRIITSETEGVFSTGPAFGVLTVASLTALEPAMRIAARAALASRNDSALPVTADDRWRQRYAFGAGGSLDVRLYPYRGNLYGWLGLVGAPVPFLPHGLVDLLPGGTADLLATGSAGLSCSLAEDLLNFI